MGTLPARRQGCHRGVRAVTAPTAQTGWRRAPAKKPPAGGGGRVWPRPRSASHGRALTCLARLSTPGLRGAQGCTGIVGYTLTTGSYTDHGVHTDHGVPHHRSEQLWPWPQWCPGKQLPRPAPVRLTRGAPGSAGRETQRCAGKHSPRTAVPARASSRTEGVPTARAVPAAPAAGTGVPGARAALTVAKGCQELVAVCFPAQVH